MMFKRSWLLALLILPVAIWHITSLQTAHSESGTQINTPTHRTTETIPVYSVDTYINAPLTIDNWQLAIDHFAQGAETAVSTQPLIQKTGPAAVAPGDVAHYEITLANYEAVTRTYRLTDTLPSHLTFIPDSSTALSLNEETQTLSWEGQIPPGKLDMILTESATLLPYLDLAMFGAVNLCDDFIAESGHCRETAVTFNLGINNYAYTLYGEPLSQVTVSANGIVQGGEQDDGGNGRFHWLPDGASPNHLLAGLWRAADMSENGRFHAAILTGLIDGHDVFYAQWHDAPQVANRDATARHAIALVLDGVGGMNGHAFFIYDNIAHPMQTTAQGFVIGIEDKTGERGLTYAYAGDDHPNQGDLPTTGTTLHLRPVLFGKDFTRTFTYKAIVNAQVPETVVNTAVYTSDSPDPYLAHQWSTHYLPVRHLQYLPLFFNEVQP